MKKEQDVTLYSTLQLNNSITKLGTGTRLFRCFKYFRHSVSEILLLHCAKNNLNLRIKTQPVTTEADATLVVICLNHRLIIEQDRTRQVASSSSVKLNLTDPCHTVPCQYRC